MEKSWNEDDFQPSSELWNTFNNHCVLLLLKKFQLHFNYIQLHSITFHQYILCYLKKRKKKMKKTVSILRDRQCLPYSNQEVQISVYMELDRRMAKGDVSSNRLAIICLGVHHA